MLATEGGGDMLILLTGVGGALSARGLDIPVVEERTSSRLSVEPSEVGRKSQFNKKK